MLNERICAYCGKPIHDAKGRRKYHVECAKIVEKKQNRDWQYNEKISAPAEGQRATPETVAVALGYNLDKIDGWVLLACTLIADAANEYSDLCSGKSALCGLIRDRELEEIEEFFASFGMPTICKKIKQLSK